MIITKTPFRMSFFGGGTDMESFFKDNGGAVLSTTFDKYCYVNVRHLPRFFDYSTELSYSKTERVTDINDIQHPAIRNAMKMLDMHEIRLTYEADLPARSGLGTSSSFAVGMLNAFYEKELNHINQMISDVKPDLLIACFGCPKQEKWIYENIGKYDAKVSVCAGATVDFLAGNVKRAPRWMSEHGLEWFYRFLDNGCLDPVIQKYA